MAGFLTNHANNLVLDALFNRRGLRLSPPLQVGLSQSPANKAGVIDEPDCPSYERIEVEGDLGEVVDGFLVNTKTIRFPEPENHWGIIRSVFISSGADILAMSDLKAPKFLNRGDSAPLIESGNLSLCHN